MLHIVLEIGNAETCVGVRCLLLHSVLYAYHFNADKYTESLSVTGLCLVYLNFRWPSFTAVHILKGVLLKFREKIVLSPWTTFHMRRILSRQSFFLVSTELQ